MATTLTCSYENQVCKPETNFCSSEGMPSVTSEFGPSEESKTTDNLNTDIQLLYNQLHQIFYDKFYPKYALKIKQAFPIFKFAKFDNAIDDDERADIFINTSNDLEKLINAAIEDEIDYYGLKCDINGIRTKEIKPPESALEFDYDSSSGKIIKAGPKFRDAFKKVFGVAFDKDRISYAYTSIKFYLNIIPTEYVNKKVGKKVKEFRFAKILECDLKSAYGETYGKYYSNAILNMDSLTYKYESSIDIFENGIEYFSQNNDSVYEPNITCSKYHQQEQYLYEKYIYEIENRLPIFKLAKATYGLYNNKYNEGGLLYSWGTKKGERSNGYKLNFRNISSNLDQLAYAAIIDNNCKFNEGFTEGTEFKATFKKIFSVDYVSKNIDNANQDIIFFGIIMPLFDEFLNKNIPDDFYVMVDALTSPKSFQFSTYTEEDARTEMNRTLKNLLEFKESASYLLSQQEIQFNEYTVNFLKELEILINDINSYYSSKINNSNNDDFKEGDYKYYCSKYNKIYSYVIKNKEDGIEKTEKSLSVAYGQTYGKYFSDTISQIKSNENWELLFNILVQISLAFLFRLRGKIPVFASKITNKIPKIGPKMVSKMSPVGNLLKTDSTKGWFFVEEFVSGPVITSLDNSKLEVESFLKLDFYSIEDLISDAEGALIAIPEGAALKKISTKFRDNIPYLSEKLKNNKDILTSLNEKLKINKDFLTSNERYLSTMQKNLKKYESSLITLKNNLGYVIKRLESFNNKKTTTTSLRKQSKNEGNIERYKDKQTNSKNKITYTEGQIESTKNKIKTTSNKIKETEGQIESTKNEIKETKGQIEKYNMILDFLQLLPEGVTITVKNIINSKLLDGKGVINFLLSLGLDINETEETEEILKGLSETLIEILKTEEILKELSETLKEILETEYINVIINDLKKLDEIE